MMKLSKLQELRALAGEKAELDRFHDCVFATPQPSMSELFQRGVAIETALKLLPEDALMRIAVLVAKEARAQSSVLHAEIERLGVEVDV